jgi:integrase
MPIAITQASVRALLRDAKAGKQPSLTDAQAPGLQLRGWTNGTASWTVRCRLHDKAKRYDLGQATDGDDGDGKIGIKTARERARTVKALVEAGRSPIRQLEAWSVGGSIDAAGDVVEKPAEAPPAMTWETAREKYLAWIADNRRPDTLRDYTGKLGAVELQVFEGRAVSEITRNQLMAAVNAIAERGVDAMADGVHRVVSAFWSWLADAVRQDETGVAPNMLLGTKVTRKKKAEIGADETRYDPEAERGRVPDPLQLGRTLVIARSGAMPWRQSLGIQLLLGTLQRRRTVLNASRWRFREFEAYPDETAWMIPPYFRKSGSKRGALSHLVPCVGWVAGVVKQLDKLSADGRDTPWLFPSPVSRRDGSVPPVGEGFLNKALGIMPGVEYSPHEARHAFATFGPRELGFLRGEAKMILDHLEGIEQDDVTEMFYGSDAQVARKRQMLIAWTAWLDRQAEIALAADSNLADVDWIKEQLFRDRYGDEALDKRVARRERLGLELW